MKRLSVILAMVLALASLHPFPASAAGAGPDGLGLAELNEWGAQLLRRAQGEEPIGGPLTRGTQTEDGYELAYDFAVLYLSTPTVTQDTVLNAAVVTNADTKCLRDIYPYDTQEMLLKAFANENPDLIGSHDFAVLYLWENMPQEARWGWVQRDGQQLTQVQYAVQQRTEDGSYTDCGLAYSLEDGYITAIRAYGLSARASLDDVEEDLSQVREVKADDSYFAWPQSEAGIDLDPFQREDLIFSGLDFLSLTPEEASSTLGAYEAETWFQDDDGEWLRILQWPTAEITFAYSADKVYERVDTLALSQRGLEGPRGVMVGDSLRSVLMRFRHSGDLLNGIGVETLYGDGENPPFGSVEYQDNEATLHYACSIDGVPGIDTVRLEMIFSDTSLTELFLYSW